MIQDHCQRIKENYDIYVNNLLKSGRLPARDTGIGFWGVTPVEEAFELFKRINLGSYETFIDLGSGDGRIVLLASLFNVSAHGIEFDASLVNASIIIKRKMNLPHFSKARFVEDDFMKHDLSKYNAVFTSPDKPFSREGVEKKLLDELNGILIVHGWEFQPEGFLKKEEHVINGEKFCIYSR